MYNYYEAVRADIREYIKNEVDFDDLEIEDSEDLAEYIQDELCNEDSITGNISGSYTINSNLAKEYVMDNLDLLGEVCDEYCVSYEEVGKCFINEDFEVLDVYIRCYVLGAVAYDVAEEYDFEKKYYKVWREGKIATEIVEELYDEELQEELAEAVHYHWDKYMDGDNSQEFNEMFDEIYEDLEMELEDEGYIDVGNDCRIVKAYDDYGARKFR